MKQIAAAVLVLALGAATAAEVAVPSGDWRRFNHITDKNIAADGTVSGKFSGNDPFFHAGLTPPLAAATIEEVTFDLKLDPGCASRLQLFWSTVESPGYGGKHVTLPVRADGRWHTCRIRPRHPLWRGRLNGIRLDPAVDPKPGTGFALRNFRLVTRPARIAGIAVELPAAPAAAELTAQNELLHYLPQVLKGALTVGGTPVTRIAVNTTRFRDYAEEEWHIRAQGATLHLNGGARGVLYAVYHFLEDHCGIHWFTPRDEHIPAAREIALPALDVSGRPAFAYRSIYLTDEPADVGVFLARNRFNHGSRPIAPAYGGEFGYGKPNHCHTFHLYLPVSVYGKTHPEYFALVRGKRRLVRKAQLCLTNPELRPLLLAKLRDYIRADRRAAAAAGRAAPRLYDVSMNDDHNCCQCETCAAAAARYNHSGVMIRLLNYLAENIEAEFPDVRLTTLAYFYNEPAPKGGVKMHRNVIAKFCDTKTNQALGVAAPENAEFVKTLKQWGDAGGALFVWDYNITYALTPFLPLPSEFYYGELFRAYADLRVSGVFMEHENGMWSDFYPLKLFLAAKLLEDPRQDFPRLLDTFYTAYFGAAAPLVRRYREQLHAAVVRRRPFIDWFAPQDAFDFLDPETVLAAQRNMDAAEQAVAADPVRLRRVRQARLGLDGSTGLFLRKLRERWRKSHPDQPFPLRRTEIAARLENLARLPGATSLYRRHVQMLARRIAMFPETATVDPRFSGRKVRDYPPESLYVSYDPALEFVADPEAWDGLAVRIAADRDPKLFAPPFEMGVYDLQTGGHHGIMTLKKSDIPADGKYHWYDLGECRIGTDIYVYLSRSWQIQARLNDFRGRDFRARVYARVKFTGPWFGVPGADGKNFIYADRITLVFP